MIDRTRAASHRSLSRGPRSALLAAALALVAPGCDRVRNEAPLSTQLARHAGTGYAAELRCSVRLHVPPVSGRNTALPDGCEARAELIVRGGTELTVSMPGPAVAGASSRECARARAWCASLRGSVRARAVPGGDEVLAAYIEGAPVGRITYVAAGGFPLYGPEPMPAASADALLAAAPSIDESVRAQITAQRLSRPAEHLERALAGPLFERFRAELLVEAEACRLPASLVAELARRGAEGARERLFVSGVRDRLCAATLEALVEREPGFLRERLPRALAEHAPSVIDEPLGRLALAAWIARTSDAAAALVGFVRAMPAGDAPTATRAAWVTTAFALAGIAPERASAVAIEVLPRLDEASELAGLPRREVTPPNPRLWGFESSRARALAAMLVSGATQPVRDGLAALAGNAAVSRAARQVAIVSLAASRDPRAVGLATTGDVLTQRQQMVVTGRGGGRASGAPTGAPGG